MLMSPPEPLEKGRTDAFAGLPGNPMMWLLIASELLVFGAALLAFSGARALAPLAFAGAQTQLDRLTGLLNVMVLLTSGLFAALAVQAIRSGSRSRARLHLAAAGALGLVFLAFKILEYRADFAAGLSFESGTFFMLYFLITGFHALHVVLGVLLLGIVAVFASPENIETGAAFWHMVDLVWLLVFPVVYLIR